MQHCPDCFAVQTTKCLFIYLFVTLLSLDWGQGSNFVLLCWGAHRFSKQYKTLGVAHAAMARGRIFS